MTKREFVEQAAMRFRLEMFAGAMGGRTGPEMAVQYALWLWDEIEKQAPRDPPSPVDVRRDLFAR